MKNVKLQSGCWLRPAHWFQESGGEKTWKCHLGQKRWRFFRSIISTFHAVTIKSSQLSSVVWLHSLLLAIRSLMKLFAYFFSLCRKFSTQMTSLPSYPRSHNNRAKSFLCNFYGHFFRFLQPSPLVFYHDAASISVTAKWMAMRWDDEVCTRVCGMISIKARVDISNLRQNLLSILFHSSRCSHFIMTKPNRRSSFVVIEFIFKTKK